MPDYELIRDMVDAIQDRGVGVTDWEKEFIASIIGQFKMRGYLSPKQIVIVERIYRQRTPDENARPLTFNTVTGLTPAQQMTSRVREEGQNDYGRSGRERLAREKGYDE